MEEIITMTRNLMNEVTIYLGQADSIDQLTDYLAFQVIYMQGNNNNNYNNLYH